jgi:hypothetical protein
MVLVGGRLQIPIPTWWALSQPSRARTTLISLRRANGRGCARLGSATWPRIAATAGSGLGALRWAAAPLIAILTQVALRQLPHVGAIFIMVIMLGLCLITLIARVRDVH